MPAKLKRCLTGILFASILWAAPIFHLSAEKIVTLQDNAFRYRAGGIFSILEDKTGKLLLKDILTPEKQKLFKTAKSNAPSMGLSRSAFWVRLPVKNESRANKKWLLQIAYPVLDRVEFYADIPGNGAPRLSGDSIPYSRREYRHKNIIFNLNIAPGETRVLYLRITSSNSVSLPLSIWEQEHFFNNDHTEQYLLGLYFGIILVMFLYNFFIYFSLKDLSYIHYVLFLACFGFYQLCMNGLAFEYIWPEATWWANRSPLVFIVGTGFFTAGFSRAYCLLDQYAPRTNQLLKYIQYANALMLLLVLILPSYYASYSAIFLPMAAAFISFFGGVLALRGRYRPAYYFLLSWTAFLGGALVFGFRALGILPLNFFTLYGMQIGSAVLVILLALGLSYRINIMKEEKEEAIKKLNEAYARFVPREFLKFLEKDSIIDVALGDQNQRDMTILFADIRAFTTLSETMTPKETFDFINSFLRRMGPIIRKNNGFIDKYIGDGIMALFPGSPEDAINAAIEMQTRLKEYNRKRITYNYKPIRVGTGIHTGSLMLGTIGEIERMDSTVISDAVNLAARMENVTKEYGAQIIMSGPTLYALKNANTYNFRLLGNVKVKGKAEPVTAFEIFDGDNQEFLDLKKETKSDFELAVQHFINGKFGEAAAVLKGILEKNPEDTAAQVIYNYSLGYVDEKKVS